MKRIALLLLVMAVTACAKTHKDPQDIRDRAARGFWGKSVSENYRLLFADVMIGLQNEVRACYGGGPVQGSRPGSGSNLSTTAFYPEIRRNDSDLTATITIWRAKGADASGDEAKQKRRAMFLVDIKGSGDGRSTVTVFGPRRGRNDEMQSFQHWASGGKGQCVWR